MALREYACAKRHRPGLRRSRASLLAASPLIVRHELVGMFLHPGRAPCSPIHEEAQTIPRPHSATWLAQSTPDAAWEMEQQMGIVIERPPGNKGAQVGSDTLHIAGR